MFAWLGRWFGGGTEADEPQEEIEDLDIYERVERLEERVKRLDERTRKQRYREGEGAADAPAAQVPNGADRGNRRKVELMRAFQASRQAGA